MKKFIIFYIILTFFMMIGVTFAGEKYCFDCMHKYRIGDKKNETYEFNSDLESTVYVSFRNSIGRKQDIDLTNLDKSLVCKSNSNSYVSFFLSPILYLCIQSKQYFSPANTTPIINIKCITIAKIQSLNILLTFYLYVVPFC